jgi:cyclase
VKLTLIVARIKPGAAGEVARIFAESDATELPHLAGVRRRRLFTFHDVYIHLLETDDDADVETVRNHPLFVEVSERLAPYIEAYEPTTWRSPRDAIAQEFYAWDRLSE